MTPKQNSGVINPMSVCTRHLTNFAATRLCVLQDDIGDNRSVLVAPAQDIRTEEVNRIITVTGGLTFVAITPERAGALMLTPMPGSVSENSWKCPHGILNQYTSVEAREGVTTGISAADRATTIRTLGSKHPHPRSLVKPGHIFPVATKEGGTLVRATIPEAALDITMLAGFSDAALFIDFLDHAGDFISAETAANWADLNKIPLITVSELIRHRLIIEPLIERISEARLPTAKAGTVKAIAYRSKIHDVEHIALVKGEIVPNKPTLVRVQVEHTIADVFGGNQPNTRDQISHSLQAIEQQGSGVFLYLRRSSLADLPLFSDANPAPSLPPQTALNMREYGVGAQILRDLGISQIELLSSTQRNLEGLDSFGISVVTQRAISTND